MKAPVYKFVAFAFAGLLAISCFKGDSHRFCNAEGLTANAAPVTGEEQVMELAEEAIQNHQQTEEEHTAFQFPNIFDALRFIF